MATQRRFGAVRRVLRRRTPLVVLPLVVLLATSGLVGARLLFAEPQSADATAPSSVCWDGSEVADLSSCARPKGVRGLRWVFPSFSPRGDSCQDVRTGERGSGRPTVWMCDFEIAGSPVTITYSELRSVAGGRAAFDEEYAGSERSTVEASDGTPLRHEWRRELPGGTGYAVTAMYVGHPYAVQVVAERKVLREDALASTVRFRAPGSLGRP
ncbi:hypothetical protein [Nocardioides lijunqiniae]|uniref:hypothetical protein n=1 Tax=Nocardioides lijunqiniae TaxID=2760832 RepID=UPI001877A932|nr:hypothetical protein [Nocardioides lijunqiniae]